MKPVKRLSLIILSIIGFILCFVLTLNFFEYRSNIVNEITGVEIRKVKMGMTLEEVVSILGKPYEMHALEGLHNFNCENPKSRLEMSVNENTDIIHIVDSVFDDVYYCCDGNREDIQKGKRVTLTYTKPVKFSKYYPMLWVHLDSNYRVWNVFAKQYEFMDDVCIYSLSWKRDGTTLEFIQGEIELFINDELFNQCFKSKK